MATGTTKTKGKIATRALHDTGVTTEMSTKAYNELTAGKNGVTKLVGIVTLIPDSFGGKKGEHNVTFQIQEIEIAPNEDTAEWMRRVQRAVHYERRLEDGQLEISGMSDLEPSIEQIKGENPGITYHEFAPREGQPDECNVCGRGASVPVHDKRSDLEDPFAVPEPAKKDEVAAKRGSRAKAGTTREKK